MYDCTLKSLEEGAASWICEYLPNVDAKIRDETREVVRASVELQRLVFITLKLYPVGTV